MFDAATGAEISRLDHDGAVNAVAFSPTAPGSPPAATIDGSARVFDAATGAEISRLDHDGAVNAVAFSPTAPGSPPAAATIGGSARVFDAATGDRDLPPGPRRRGERGGVQTVMNGGSLSRSTQDQVSARSSSVRAPVSSDTTM